MADSSIDLLALNREILLNPKAAGNNELVALLELEKPGLEFLCPMAQAIYWIETKQKQRIDPEEVLRSLYCIDDSEANGDGHAYIKEVVLHSITLALGDLEIVLGFNSLTEMIYHGQYWPRYVRYASAIEWNLDMEDRQAEVVAAWFRSIEINAKDCQKFPQGYPVDSGEFIGTTSYTLVSINSLTVDGPTFSDTHHEQSWSGLNVEFMQRWEDDCDLDNSVFCFLHYLGRDQADQIGIAAIGKQALGPDQNYPEWVPKKLDAFEEALWIHSDRIKHSYDGGTLVIEPSKEAWIAVGCGSAWDPTDPDNQLNPEEKVDWDEFPETMGPRS